MRMTLSVVSGFIDIDNVFYLVIENPDAMYRFINDIYIQSIGEEGEIILSEESKILKLSKCVELITTYIPFDINEKRILNKIVGILEKEAVNELNYGKTMELLAQIENYVSSLTDMFNYSFDYSGISVTSLIKMCGISIIDDSLCKVDKLVIYMDMVRELLGDKLFVFVNPTSYYPKDMMLNFIETVKTKGHKVLIVDSMCRDYIKDIDRLIIDDDLCII